MITLNSCVITVTPNMTNHATQYSQTNCDSYKVYVNDKNWLLACNLIWPTVKARCALFYCIIRGAVQTVVTDGFMNELWVKWDGKDLELAAREQNRILVELWKMMTCQWHSGLPHWKDVTHTVPHHGQLLSSPLSPLNGVRPCPLEVTGPKRLMAMQQCVCQQIIGSERLL